MPRKIEISHKTILFTISVVLFLWLFAQIISVVVSLFIAILLTTALDPVVDKLTKFKVPRGLSILILYILLIGGLVWGLSSIVSPLVEQTTNLANRLPVWFDQLGDWLESIGVEGIDGSLVAQQFSQLGAIPANLVHFLIFIFSNLVSVIAILVITFYMLLERKNLSKYLLALFGGEGEARAKTFIDRLEMRLGGWVRGELLLMLIIGLITYIGLLLLKIPYALPLAILAGLLEILPNIGPIISAIPAILVGFTISPLMGLAVASLYFFLQQLENSLVAPKIMQKAAGVNPLVTIISLAVGFQVGGAMGAILAVPAVIVLQVIADVLNIKSLNKLEE